MITVTRENIENIDWEIQRDLYVAPMHINHNKKEMTLMVNTQFLATGKPSPYKRMAIIPLDCERMPDGWEYGEPIPGRNVMCDRGLLDADFAHYQMGILSTREVYQCEWDRFSVKPINQLVWKSFKRWALEQIDQGTILREEPDDFIDDGDEYIYKCRRRRRYMD